MKVGNGNFWLSKCCPMALCHPSFGWQTFGATWLTSPLGPWASTGCSSIKHIIAKAICIQKCLVGSLLSECLEESQTYRACWACWKCEHTETSSFFVSLKTWIVPIDPGPCIWFSHRPCDNDRDQKPHRSKIPWQHLHLGKIEEGSWSTWVVDLRPGTQNTQKHRSETFGTVLENGCGPYACKSEESIKPAKHIPRHVERKGMMTHQSSLQVVRTKENVESHELSLQIFEATIGMLITGNVSSVLQAKNVSCFQTLECPQIALATNNTHHARCASSCTSTVSSLFQYVSVSSLLC